jgi:hypothetical protein
LPWRFRLIVKHEDLSPAQMQLKMCKQYDTCWWSLHKLWLRAPLLIHESVEGTSCRCSSFATRKKNVMIISWWKCRWSSNSLGLWPPVHKLLQLLLDFE